MDNDDVIDTLNHLIETCKDGEFGFRSCAENAQRSDLRQILANRAEDCRRGALELQALVTGLGGEAGQGGTAGGAVHRGWVAVKAKLTGYTDLALLEECERGEDLALAQYQNALAEDLPVPVALAVRRQYEGVKTNHAQMRVLRNELRAGSPA